MNPLPSTSGSLLHLTRTSFAEALSNKNPSDLSSGNAQSGGQSGLHQMNNITAAADASSAPIHSLSTVNELPPSVSRGQRTVDDEGYELVQRPKRKRKPVVGSKAVPLNLRSLQPVSRQKTLFVSRLPPEATAEDLMEYIEQVFGGKASCTKIVSGQFHSSFKVTVDTPRSFLLFKNSQWPEGAYVRRYYVHGY